MTTDRIYLTGFMGAGKSTVGPLLAERLQVPFIDLDAAIEILAGRSIADIFQEDGEGAFRRIEGEALRRTTKYARAVVALGGGTVVDEENLGWVKDQGCLVYLQVPPSALVDRLEPEAHDRPLLHDRAGTPYEGEALEEHIEQLLVDRERFYRQAHHVVGANLEPELLVRKLYLLLKRGS